MKNRFKALHERVQESEKRIKRTSIRKESELMIVLTECSDLFKEMEPIKRRLFLDHVVEELHEKQNGICPLCDKAVGLDEFDVDHIIPWYWGGGNERTNLQVTHQSCNRSKGSNVEDIHDLVVYLEDRMMNF